MPIRFECPCGRVLKALEELQGKKVRCPQCGNPVEVPLAPPPPPVQVAPPPAVVSQLQARVAPPPQGAPAPPPVPAMATLLPLAGADAPQAPVALPRATPVMPADGQLLMAKFVANAEEPASAAASPSEKTKKRTRKRTARAGASKMDAGAWLYIIGTSSVPLIIGIVYTVVIYFWERGGSSTSMRVPRIVKAGYEIGGVWGVLLFSGLISLVVGLIMVRKHLNGTLK